MIAPSAQANPVGGVAVHGQASLASTSKTLNVTTQNGAGTSHSVINWQSFSIPPGSTTYFQQPNAASTSINRVVTNTPSLIFGTLGSNGKLVLVNQSGITVGAGAVVDTAGFTASALRMTDADALAGRLRFGDGSASGGAVSVQGSILARSGDVVLLAHTIDTGKDALIQAPNGNTLLAAGRQIEITGRGLEGITLQVQAPADSVVNLGTLKGNAVAIFAGTLKHSGDIQANTVSLEGGKIVLKAVADAYIEGSGKLTAAGTLGGTVDVLGSRVAVTDQAAIDVSGELGGGTVRIGGDYQGKNPDVQNASFTYTGAQTSIKADALTSGNGGKVIVWADDTTRAYGAISAVGGALSGDGGLVETSGKRALDVAGASVDASARNGANGQWLLDPSDVTIVHGTLLPVPRDGYFNPARSGSFVGDGEINAALNSGTNVTIETTTSQSGSGNIVVTGSTGGSAVSISKTSGASQVLRLVSAGGIDIQAGATISNSENTSLLVRLESGGNTVMNGDINVNYLAIRSGGAISGTGAIVTPSSHTSATFSSESVTGTDLRGTGNRIGKWAASNTGVGDVLLDNVGAISLNGLENRVGAITVNSTNGIAVDNEISANGVVTLSAGAGDLTQTSGSLYNLRQDTTSAPGMSLSGNNIKLNNVQSAGSVMLNARGSVTLESTLGDSGFITGVGDIKAGNLSIYAGTTISGAANIVTPSLLTQSVTGTDLNGPYNQIRSWTANNTDVGNIRLVNIGSLSLGPVTNSSGAVSVSSSNGIAAYSDITANGVVTIAAGTGDLNQTSGTISNVSESTSGTPGMSLSGNNIALRSVQSAGGVLLNSLGSVNLQGLGSGGFIDDTFFSYNLPFTFNYFGTNYNQAFITTNGLITFGDGSGTSSFTDSTSRLASYRAIAPAWNDWILQANEGKDIRIAPSANSLGVRWNVGRYGDQSRTAQFESILSANGAIRFNYGAANNSFANDVTIGISNGSGINLISELMYGPNFSMNNLRSTTFTPNGQGSYTETLAAGSTPLSVFGTISGSAILGQGTGEVIAAAGALNINAGSQINAPSRLTAQSLQFQSVGGALFTGDNLFGSISLSANTGPASDVLIYNTRGDSSTSLSVAGLSNSAGAITVNTPGGIELTGRLDASTTMALTAQSGTIVQTLASTGIFSPLLITSSSGGTTLAYSDNQIGSFSSNNAGSGNVELVTSGPLVVGSITNPLGRVLITDSSGDMSLGAISASSITLSALAGGISQTADFSTPGLLATSSRNGTVLNQVNNHVGSFRAINTGPGNIRLTNVGAIDIQGINASNGVIRVNNTGGISTSGVVTAPYGSVVMTANSPLTIGSEGVLAGGNINLTATNLTSAGNVTLNGPITSSGGSITMIAASNFTQNSSVNAAGGVTATAGTGFTFGPLATTTGNPVVYRVGATQQLPPPSPARATSEATVTIAQPVSSSPTDFVVAFLTQLEDKLTEKDSDTDKAKKTKDGVVIGAQTCSR